MRRWSPSIRSPYTTLFRSRDELSAEEQLVIPMTQGTERLREPGRCRRGTGHWLLGEVTVRRDIEVVHVLANPQDRKSTRLNSSHLVISYAVFCLNKNN